MANPDARRLLAAAVTARRVELRHTKESAGREAGIDSQTWKRVEDALGVRDTTYPAVERVLRWQPGSVYSVLAGGEPTLVGPSADDASYVSSSPGSVPLRDATLDELLAEVARRARASNPEAT